MAVIGAVVIDLFSRRSSAGLLVIGYTAASPWRLCAEPWRSAGRRRA